MGEVDRVAEDSGALERTRTDALCAEDLFAKPEEAEERVEVQRPRVADGCVEPKAARHRGEPERDDAPRPDRPRRRRRFTRERVVDPLGEGRAEEPTR
jgi:hypothetical protein